LEKVEKKVTEELTEEEPTEAVVVEPLPETPESQKTPADQVKTPVTLKKKEPKKVVKKPKKESAAKIIQLPVKPVEKAPEKKVATLEKPKGEVRRMPSRPPAAKPVVPPQEVIARETKKKKSKQKHAEDVEGNKKFLKKKISFRKKSVIEGAALYDSGYRTRKPRKGAKGRAAATGQKNSNHNSQSHQTAYQN
jgi:translation initiation factor IF-2